MIEYVIWGKAPNSNREELLLEKIKGEPLTSRRDAEHYKMLLETHHGATDCRIQEIRFNSPEQDLLDSFKNTVDTRRVDELARSLVKMGYTNPELRPHLRPVLDAINIPETLSKKAVYL
jgi:hypothetical protein